MSLCDNSWQFLEDFYDQDRKIVELCNTALGIRSRISLDGRSKQAFFNSLFSTLDRQQKSYADFVDFVSPQSENLDEDISDYDKPENSEESNVKKPENEKENDDTKIENAENIFLDSIWVQILSRSGAGPLISKKASQYIKDPAKPYLILLSMGIYRDWFLFGGRSQNFFVEKANKMRALQKRLQRGYRNWNSFWHFYGKLSNIKSILTQTKVLSAEQLYPLVVLLIILRREWKSSQTKEYVKIKLDSLVKDENTMQERLAILHALYNKYPKADEDLKKRLEEKLDTRVINTIHFHPVVAKNIIASKSYDYLYDCEEMAYRFSQNKAKKVISDFIASEVEYKKLETNGSRLLMDYLFPYTEIDMGDVFVPIPKDSDEGEVDDRRVLSEVFISFRIGSHYKEVYREPRTGELFDYIQLYYQNERGRVMFYNQFRKPGGEFWKVRSKEDQILNERLKKEFADFRHGMQQDTGISRIESLKERLQKTVSITERLSRLLELAERFLQSSDIIVGKEYASALAAADKMKDNEFPELEMNVSIVKNPIQRQIVIVDGFLKSGELGNEKIKKLQKNVNRVQQYVNDMQRTSISKYQKDLDIIEWKFKNIVGYINMAGVDNIDGNKLERFVLRDFIEMLIKNREKQNIIFSFGNKLDQSWIVNYNKPALMTILNSIIENAQKHGFASDYKCENPTIQFDVCLKDDGFLVLKVCNNGKPIMMRTEDYVTRGVFGRETGHTGIGGYQTNRFAEMLGGKVEVYSKKEWNTEIHLYIKYNNTYEPNETY